LISFWLVDDQALSRSMPDPQARAVTPKVKFDIQV
jgi:hypothetical protein